MRTSPFEKQNPNALDTIKDNTYAMYTFGVSSGKDAMAAGYVLKIDRLANMNWLY